AVSSRHGWVISTSRSPLEDHIVPPQPPARPAASLGKDGPAATHIRRPAPVVLLLVVLERQYHDAAHHHRPHPAASRHAHPPHRPVPHMQDHQRHNQPCHRPAQNPFHASFSSRSARNQSCRSAPFFPPRSTK